MRAFIKKKKKHSVINICFCFVAPCSAADPPSADLDQLELPVLCDGLRRYLQDLPQPIIPAALSAQMVHAAKGEKRRTPAEAARSLLRATPACDGTFCSPLKTRKTSAQIVQTPLFLTLSFAFFLFLLAALLSSPLLSGVLHAQPRFSHSARRLQTSGHGDGRNRISVVNTS